MEKWAESMNKKATKKTTSTPAKPAVPSQSIEAAASIKQPAKEEKPTANEMTAPAKTPSAIVVPDSSTDEAKKVLPKVKRKRVSPIVKRG